MELTNEQAGTIALMVQKLAALRITNTFQSIEAGPIVSTYYFKLGADVPIAKILKAEEDMALAVGAPSVLITRSGGQIAIAIPNRIKEEISYDRCLHELMCLPNYNLPIMLGVDTRGKPKFLELTECPHTLIAGSTGGGKSVLLSAIISGLATVKTPRELKLMLIDTKQLDLPLFASLPHVVENADTLDQVRTLLDRLHVIVRQRTSRMKGLARNIAEYNALQLGSHLPYYVVVIDELADTLMQDRSRGKGIRGYEKAEHKLQSLLQICRASGIHVICATQRPSVEIITGDIKANMPTRIALRLPSGADSRTVLNEYGAEQLLGRGDMLIESPLFDQITRFHGPYVSMNHIASVIANSAEIRESYRILSRS